MTGKERKRERGELTDLTRDFVFASLSLSQPRPKSKKKKKKKKKKLQVLTAGPLPSHVAFIMDGNRRFAESHLGTRDAAEGHAAGYRRPAVRPRVVSGPGGQDGLGLCVFRRQLLEAAAGGGRADGAGQGEARGARVGTRAEGRRAGGRKGKRRRRRRRRRRKEKRKPKKPKAGKEKKTGASSSRGTASSSASWESSPACLRPSPRRRGRQRRPPKTGTKRG